MSDSGIGISAADLPHVFNRLYRADRERSNSDHVGLGLGLLKGLRLCTVDHSKYRANSARKPELCSHSLVITMTNPGSFALMFQRQRSPNSWDESSIRVHGQDAR